MSPTFNRFHTLEDGETEIEVEITVNSWGSLPQTYGPAESCDPGEPMEVEVTAAWLVGDAEPRPDVLASLTEAERQRFEVAFCEDPPEDDADDYDFRDEP